MLLQKADRWFRDIQYGMGWIGKFAQYGVEVNFVEQWIPYGTGTENTLLGIYLGQAADESLRKSNRVKDTLEEIKRNGYYAWSTPPPGYKIESIEETGRKTLKPDGERYELIKEMLLKFATGNFKKSYLFKELGQKAKLTRSRFYECFNNIKYAGLIKCKAYKHHPESIIKACWFENRMIDKTDYDTIQLIIASQNRRNSKRNHALGTKTKEIYWLKGHLICQNTNRTMTASRSTGKLGKGYSYYHLSEGRGGQRIKAEVAHSIVKKAIHQFNMSEEELREKVRIEKSKIIGKKQNLKSQILLHKGKISKFENAKSDLKSKVALGAVTISEFRDLMNHLEIETESLKTQMKTLLKELDELTQKASELPQYISSLPSIFPTGNFKIKDAILREIFPNGFFIDIEKEVIHTEKVNSDFMRILNLSSRKSKIKVFEK